MSATATDRIERQILLKAPLDRVWRALTDVREFGTWFGARLEGAIAPGATVRGRVTSPGYEHVELEMWIERVEPQRLLAYRWHPHAVEPGVDVSGEPTTRVEMRLEAVGASTRLTVVESGFDALPPERRALAYRMNSGGWESQLKNVERHVAAG